MDFARNETIAAQAVAMTEAFFREGAMQTYRIYKLNQAGRIVTGTDAMCASDDAAFRFAASLFGPNARAEIWHRDRRVGQLGGAAGSMPADQQAFRHRDPEGLPLPEAAIF